MADDSLDRPLCIEGQGVEEFHKAAKNNDLYAVRKCLDENVDIDAANTKGLTALHLACREGNCEIVKELISKGANIHAITKKQNTPLHVASLGGKLDVVKELINHGADVDLQAENGMTSLYMAAQENHVDVARELLSHNAKAHLSAKGGFDPVDVAVQQKNHEMTAFLTEHESKRGFKALHVIARKDDHSAAALLLKNGYDPNITAPNGYTPLHIAAKYGSINTAILLIESAANVQALAKHMISPLHVAAKHGQTGLLSLLIEADASLNATTKDGLTPLHCAARDGHEHCVELLLVHNASLTSKTRHGLTALHMAAQGNHVNCANFLLGHGCHIDSPTSEGVTPLHVAAHYGNLNVAQLLLDRGADIDRRAKNGYTALHVACKKNRDAVVQLLIRYGADVHMKNLNGQTALHLAAFFGLVNIVLILIQCGAYIEVTTIREETILHIACRTKQISIVRLLLRNGAKVDPRSKLDETPLLIACRQGSDEIVSLLLDEDADADARNKDDCTALHIAAKDGNYAIIECLLDHGASVNPRNKRQYTPLHEASKGGHTQVAQLLLEKNADINAQAKNNLTPLHLACHYQHLDAAVLLIESGAELQMAAKNGFTPLHIVSKKNNLELTSLLLANGVDVDKTTWNGISPLHIAASEGNVSIADALLENGASPGIQTKNGLTPLHLAARYNHVDVVKKLIKYAAPINAQTLTGFTPLHVAAFYDHVDVANLLLQDGADVEAKTKNANTALHIAALRGYTEMVELLLKYNAPTNTLNKDGFTALYIAEITQQTIIIETLIKVTHVVIRRTEKNQLYSRLFDHVSFMNPRYRFPDVSDNKISADRLKLTLTIPEDLEETQLVEKDDESDIETLNTRITVHEDFEESFLGFEESTPPESAHESFTIDTTTETVTTKVTETIVKSETTSAPIFETSLPGIILTSEEKDMIDNMIDFEPPTVEGFLISFLVDAKGGIFESSQTGIRLTIPSGACVMPTRITCRFLRFEKKILLPRLSVNEGFISKVVELAPQGIQFLKTVTIEVPHFGSLRQRERELIVMRNDPDSDYWREHVSTRIHSEVMEENAFSEMPTSPEHGSKSGVQFVRIVTQDFPERFVIVARPRKEKCLMFSEGGVIKSRILPKAQVIFDENTLNTNTKIVTQVQLMDESLLHPDDSANYSSVIKLEPHMRLINPITVVLPCPWLTPEQSFGVSSNLRLVALMPDSNQDLTESGDWTWNDVTDVCSLTAIEGCCRFQTTFLTTYWLVEYDVPEKIPIKAKTLYSKLCALPYLAKFVIFGRGLTADTAELRVLCVTDDKIGKALEQQEGFVEIARSHDVEVYDDQIIHLTCSGNMTPAGKNLKIRFKPFKENRLSFKVSSLNALDPWNCRMGFIRSLRKDKQGRVPLLCNLDATLSVHAMSRGFSSPIRNAVGSKVSDDLLQLISRKIGDQWRQLATTLGMNDADIQGAIDLSSDNHELAALTLLELWRSSKGEDATFENLRDALESVGRGDLCELVESRSPNTLSPESSRSGSVGEKRVEEAMNLNELQTSKLSDDNEMLRFEFPDSHSSPVENKAAHVDEMLSAELPKKTLLENFDYESLLEDSEEMTSQDHLALQDSPKTAMNDTNQDTLMGASMEQNEEGYQAKEEELKVSLDYEDSCSTDNAPDSKSAGRVIPASVVCDEAPFSVIQNDDVESSLTVDFMENLPCDDNDVPKPKPEEEKLTIPSLTGESSALIRDPTVESGAHELEEKLGTNNDLKESTDINENFNETDRITVQAEITPDCKTTLIDGTDQGNHPTRKDDVGGDLIKQMFAGDQSVLAFFDAPQAANDAGDKDGKGITFI